MEERAILRIGDIELRIAEIRKLLSGKSFEQIDSDNVARAALERFFEIISEASRHPPEAWKREHAEVRWRRIADIGNVIRHAYDRVDLKILWEICGRDLTLLERAIDAMREAHAAKGGSV